MRAGRAGQLATLVLLTAFTGLACSLVALHLDRAGALWSLAHRDREPWLSLRCALGPLGRGAVHAGAGVLLVIIGLVRRQHAWLRLGKCLLLALLAATAVASGVKCLVRRPRPEYMDAPRPPLAVQLNSNQWHSFPSGDVLAATSLTLVAWGLVGRQRRWWWLLVIPLLVGAQRFLAARHYLSDVLAAMCLGAMIGSGIASRASRRPAVAGASADAAPHEPPSLSA